MAMVRLDVLVSAVAADAGLDPDRVTQHKTEIVRWINETRREIYELPVKLSALEFSGEVAAVADVTAGTVGTTLDLAEVTGASTSFVTAMAGRYIQIADFGWQRIAYVSSSTILALESPWPRAAVSAKAYRIWKRHYDMPPKVSRIETFVDMSNPLKEMAYYDPVEFHSKFGFGDSSGDPFAYTQYNSRDMADAYLGSTVYASISVTANSPIVDFASGAGIVTGLAPGDRLLIGNSTTSTAFYVDKILSDTKAAVREYVQITNSSLSASAMSLDRLQVQFYPYMDGSRIVMYKARKEFIDLYNNNDFLEPGWYMAVKTGAVAKAMAFVGNPREDKKSLEYHGEIINLTRVQFKAHNPAPRLKPYVGQRYGDRTMFPSKRDD